MLCEYPFSCNVDHVELQPQESIELKVSFDPAYKVDKVCGVLKTKEVGFYFWISVNSQFLTTGGGGGLWGS